MKKLLKKVLNSKLLIVTIFLIVTAMIFFIWYFIITPKIILNGKKHIILDINQNYHEEGYKASYLGKNLTNIVKVSNDLDTSKIGNYYITYFVKYKGKKKLITRKVSVRDLEKPIITLKGNNISKVCPNQEYIEEGYKVVDNYDKDITNKVEIIKYKDKIIYQVKDSSNNISKKERKLLYIDDEKPIINLIGDSEVFTFLNENYNDLGVSIDDNCDKNLEKKLIVTNNVNVNKEGTYEIVYEVIDSSGNENSIKRKVNVIKKEGLGKTIYLTFDDGPSSITNKILDILKEENIKATFFVTKNVLNYPSILKREYEENHSIGLHTYSHNYKEIYSSVDNYFEDLEKIKLEVYNITQFNSDLIRFPGGSSNTISRNYSKGIMSRLVKKVKETGYKYMDWNISSGDAGGAKNSEDVYDNVIKNLKYEDNVVLMHDFENNFKTLNALKNIINYAKQNGYIFSKITMSTQEIHHGVNN